MTMTENIYVEFRAAEREKRRLSPADIAAGLRRHRTMNPGNWGTSPLEAAKIRERRLHEDWPGAYPGPQEGDGQHTGRSDVADLRDILADPWNAVSKRLPDGATAIAGEVALQAALYCEEGEFQLYVQIVNGEHLPAWVDSKTEKPSNLAEEAYRNWNHAGDVARTMLADRNLDLSRSSPRGEAPFRSHYAGYDPKNVDPVLRWRDFAVDDVIELRESLDGHPSVDSRTRHGKGAGRPPSPFRWPWTREGKARPERNPEVERGHEQMTGEKSTASDRRPLFTWPWEEKNQRSHHRPAASRLHSRETEGQDRGSDLGRDIF